MAGISNARYGEVDTAYGREDAWFLRTDSIGNFLSAKVLGSTLGDRGYMVYPLSNGDVIGGGFYDTSNGAFQGNTFYGVADVFLVEFAGSNLSVQQTPDIERTIKVYPNPAGNILNATSSQVIKDITIKNLLGQTILSRQTEQNAVQLNVEGLPAGIYIVRINGEYVQRIMKE
jgi:hypothetical protein